VKRSLLLSLSLLLAGCTPAALAVLSTGAQTAEDVARVGCSLLGSAQTPTDQLAAAAAFQRAITEALARGALERGASEAEVEAILRSMAALTEAIRAQSDRIGTLAGAGPVRVAPCPALPPPAAPVSP
jgi:hypothetical protein